MTRLLHSQAKDNYPLIALISPDGIARLNKIFNTHYTKSIITNQIKITRKEHGFDFWNKLTRGNKQARIERVDEKN